MTEEAKDNGSQIVPFKPPRAEMEPLTAGLDRYAFEPNSIEEGYRFAQILIDSGLLPKALTKKAEVFALVVQGRELNLSAMQSIRSIHVIDGKPGLSARMKHALVLASGKGTISIVETSDTKCVVKATRGGESTVFTWTVDMAARAGLNGKGPWKAYPQAMLRARAIGDAADTVFPDVTQGVATAEALSDGEVLDVTPTAIAPPASRAEALVVKLKAQAPPPAAAQDPEVTSEGLAAVLAARGEPGADG